MSIIVGSSSWDSFVVKAGLEVTSSASDAIDVDLLLVGLADGLALAKQQDPFKNIKVARRTKCTKKGTWIRIYTQK